MNNVDQIQNESVTLFLHQQIYVTKKSVIKRHQLFLCAVFDFSTIVVYPLLYTRGECFFVPEKYCALERPMTERPRPSVTTYVCRT